MILTAGRAPVEGLGDMLTHGEQQFTAALSDRALSGDGLGGNVHETARVIAEEADGGVGGVVGGLSRRLDNALLIFLEL